MLARPGPMTKLRLVHIVQYDAGCGRVKPLVIRGRFRFRHCILSNSLATGYESPSGSVISLLLPATLRSSLDFLAVFPWAEFHRPTFGGMPRNRYSQA